jgi:hypothetical protein
LIEIGFSPTEIERLDAEDVRTVRMLAAEVRRQKVVDALLLKLDIAEAVNFAMVGSTPDKHRRNESTYGRWQRSVLAQVAKLTGRETETVWGGLGRSRHLRKG